MASPHALDSSWGGLVQLDVRFRDRSRWLTCARSLIGEVCSEYLESLDITQQLVTAAQELLENLVKYSSGERATFRFELSLHQGQPIARITTRNTAASEELARAAGLLSRIIGAPDPVELFAALLAQSGDQHGSGLGLVRLRAEAGLDLSYTVEKNCLALQAERAVQPRYGKVFSFGV